LNYDTTFGCFARSIEKVRLPNFSPKSRCTVISAAFDYDMDLFTPAKPGRIKTQGFGVQNSSSAIGLR
jgi:hypothetical protein